MGAKVANGGGSGMRRGVTEGNREREVGRVMMVMVKKVKKVKKVKRVRDQRAWMIKHARRVPVLT
ncbi:MAG: hypothetical protein J5I62_07450 [Flavobacteriales bacterium]|nr:hypothetical protein [Flavobacteriales bacterium]MEB2340893.1 hypothetical protein [Flavobacteriia bacterium]